MVTTPDSSSNHNTAASSGASGDCNSPKPPRKNLASPWAQVVRGADPESSSGNHQSPPSSSSPSSPSLTTSATSVPDQPPPSDFSLNAVPAPPPVDNSNSNSNTNAVAVDSSDANFGNAGRPKKPAWKKPSNGAEVGPVMGAVSWPALSKSTKASAKSSADSSSNSKTAPDGSQSSSQGPDIILQGPVASLSPQKQGISNAKPNSATNYNMSNRQRSMKRGGGSSTGSGPSQSSSSNPPPPPPLPPPFPFQLPPGSFGNVVPGVPDPTPRDPYRNNNWDTRPPVGGFMPAMNEHRSSSRRVNFGPHPRGDGSYHHNSYGSRRDQDRGNYANTRDAHVHQQRMSPRGSVRHPPPNTAAYVGPQPLAPFPNRIGFPDFYYFPTLPMEPFGGMPFFTHGPPPAMFFPAAEPSPANTLVNQIDYYFSDANLVRDEFLRSNMDGQGWVPVTLIANFPRVRNLTSNIQFILDSLRTSTVVEVQGDKLRRRNEWMKWLPSAQLRADSGSISPGRSSVSNLATNFQEIALEEATKDEGNADPLAEASAGRYPTESSSQSQLPNGAAAGNSN